MCKSFIYHESVNRIEVLSVAIKMCANKRNFSRRNCERNYSKRSFVHFQLGFIDTIYKFRHGYSTCCAVFAWTISRHECKKCGGFSVTQKMSNTQESCCVTFFIDYLLVNYQSLVWVLYFTSTMMWLGRVVWNRIIYAEEVNYI